MDCNWYASRLTWKLLQGVQPKSEKIKQLYIFWNLPHPHSSLCLLLDNYIVIFGQPSLYSHMACNFLISFVIMMTLQYMYTHAKLSQGKIKSSNSIIQLYNFIGVLSEHLKIHKKEGKLEKKLPCASGPSSIRLSNTAKTKILTESILKRNKNIDTNI